MKTTLTFLLALLSLSSYSSDLENGKYMFQASGCMNCHTANRNEPLAGGVKIATPFGNFYAPNISSDPEFGIGKWSDEDFLKAVKRGLSPKNQYYYPAFPFSAYTKLSDEDVLDIKAYILSLAPQKKASLPHEINFLFRQRKLMFFWRALNFKKGHLTSGEMRTFKYQGEFKPDKNRSEEWNRGAYLAEAAFHCTECHTPRNKLGGLKTKQWMGGAIFDGNEVAGNITSHPESGKGNWTTEDWTLFLESGELPDGDEVSGDMYRVVRNGTAKLTEEDRMALITYLKDLKSVNRTVKLKESTKENK
ncbi:MAG: cytochrome c [Bacteriovoracaceae bacterium]|nr:cytochrome c [Bacteriovoracaceae bacterium]